MKLKNNRLLYALIAVLTLGIVGGLSPLTAQEDDEDVFTLSPFTIDEQENVGYLARSSLAGTRLKTPLRDIAATISVVTEEFMDDTGSTDLQELLVYTANTEVLGIGGNFANPDESRSVGGVLDAQFTRPTQNTRVRGLAAADLTRNYFPTIVAMDSYNTSRVVINRGANSILFGLGSPAGIINNQIIAPVFENHGEVSFQYGSYDSHRTEFDVEKVLIEDKLSIRVAALNEEQFYQQKPAFEHDSRITIAGEWRPYENTIVRATYENGSITANRPRSIPPQDMVSRWFDVSPLGIAKPTHNGHEAFQLFLRETPTVKGS
ncbi:MAG: TonB-dependent receptor plug domain-containing protein [Verrucomicrobia bacterium]|nr:TonB-dependent receptor plug domain-containing protein [Verrucomicrobiota bacterium]